MVSKRNVVNWNERRRHIEIYLRLQDVDGHIALTALGFLQRLELISLMRAAGARTDLRDAKGLTAFDYLDEEARLFSRMGFYVRLRSRVCPEQGWSH